MSFADAPQILLLILCLMLSFQAYWLASTALFPRFVEHASHRYHRPVRTTLIGLAIVLPTFLLGFFVNSRESNATLVKIIGIFVASVPLLLGLIGSAGLCELIGKGLPASEDPSPNWRHVWRGGWVLNFSFVFPLVGWVIVFPLTLISGCGAFATSFSSSGHRGHKRR
jgi:hypothetical protein